jgi:hypothetical protein
MRRFLVLAALSVFVSLTVTAMAFAITRTDRFRAIRIGDAGDPGIEPEVAA